MKNEMPQIIERQGEPNLFDSAPYLTICINTQDNKVWIQIARDDNTPNWMAFDSIDSALDFADKKNTNSFF